MLRIFAYALMLTGAVLMASSIKNMFTKSCNCSAGCACGCQQGEVCDCK